MIKIFMGLKGTGKTKALIDQVNASVSEEHGSVICIEKGDKLRFQISPQARLISADEFKINDYSSFYGFVSGLIAGNYDITALYVDSIMKICGTDDIPAFEEFIEKLQHIITNHDIKIFITVSCDVNLATDKIKKYF
ncbi:MAG: hypothetical protein DBX47_00455 [Clostridiales bacterium]|nr:MAG: hypothetical protein DBX47_00455 [Clostridiales bacterium]